MKRDMIYGGVIATGPHVALNSHTAHALSVLTPFVRIHWSAYILVEAVARIPVKFSESYLSNSYTC